MITGKVKISRKVKLLPKRYEKAKISGLKQLAKEVKEPIKDQISRGRSPVSATKGGSEGKKIWVEYDPKYAKRYKGGKLRPVNMKRTGDMLDSMVVKFVASAQWVSVYFTSPIAKYHDNKKYARKLRRLLPLKGEKFTAKLMQLMKKPILDNIKRGLREYRPK